VIPGLNAYWDAQGFYTVPVGDWFAEQERQAQLDRDRYCVGYTAHDGVVHLRFRLLMEAPELGRGSIPTGRTQTTWAPRLKIFPTPQHPDSTNTGAGSKEQAA
jgi:hypothetical protein